MATEEQLERYSNIQDYDPILAWKLNHYIFAPPPHIGSKLQKFSEWAIEKRVLKLLRFVVADH